MFNANAGWRKGPWDLTVRVRNISDVRSGTQGFDLATFCGCNEVAYKPPRFFQLATRYSF